MPLASSSPKILEEAIQLVTDEEARVELSALAEVEEVWNLYMLHVYRLSHSNFSVWYR